MTALAMLIGRFLMIIPMMAIAGNLATKKIVPPLRARSRFYTSVCGVADRGHTHRWRTHFFPDAFTRSDRRTFFNGAGSSVLT